MNERAGRTGDQGHGAIASYHIIRYRRPSTTGGVGWAALNQVQLKGVDGLCFARAMVSARGDVQHPREPLHYDRGRWPLRQYFFLQARPYASEGTWNETDPLACIEPTPAPARVGEGHEHE
jgi:hypothetical protein